MSQILSKVDLHARLKKHIFQHALITTYTFSARFFDYALDNFKALQDNGNISILVDEDEYQDLLQAASDSAESFPKRANMRYLLHPVRVPGCFHPKIFLFVSERRGLLIIGSANFTQDGLGSNAEMVAVFDYEDGKDEATLPLFQSAYHLFEQLARRWPGARLESNLSTIKGDALWLSKPSHNIQADGLPILLSNLDRPLWDQLLEQISRPISRLSILSRYFDAHPAMLELVMKTSGISKMTFYTQNVITTLTPAWLATPAFTRGDLQILLCQYADERYPQQLHGKAYAFDCGKEMLFAAGSANFTTAALRMTANDGNLEVLLCYPRIPAKQASPSKWFNPGGTAVKLRNAKQLVTALENMEEPDKRQRGFTLRLIEALVEDDKLTLKKCGDVPTGGVCRISQANMRPFNLPIIGDKKETVLLQLNPSQQKRLRNAAAIAQLGTGSLEKWTALSNPLLLTNMQDVLTGRDIRREREIREARESPQRFIDILTALSRGDDEERLKQFLTYCDIPFELAVRLFQRHHPYPGISGNHLETLRVFGSSNLKHFESLHEAVMDFVHRHQRRLNQHVECGTAKGIPNFLHILLTVANLLLSQIDWLIAGLKDKPIVEMDHDRWYRIRNNLDAYYHALGDLLELTAVSYLDAMMETASVKKIRAEFADSLPELTALYDRAVNKRNILDHLQRSHLQIVTLGQRVCGPGFFKSVLAPDKWTGFLAKIRTLQAKLAQRLAA